MAAAMCPRNGLSYTKAEILGIRSKLERVESQWNNQVITALFWIASIK